MNKKIQLPSGLVITIRQPTTADIVPAHEGELLKQGDHETLVAVCARLIIDGDVADLQEGDFGTLFKEVTLAYFDMFRDIIAAVPPTGPSGSKANDEQDTTYH